MIYDIIKKIIRCIDTFLFSPKADVLIKTETVDKEKASDADIENVLNQHGNAILRLAYSYLHNMSDAEDILQDTLIKYMESNQTFASETHKKAWLLKVASNLSKNRIDYNRVRNFDNLDELEETLVSEERAELSFVWEAVKKLPEKQREVIHLFYQEGYQTKEIAEILNRNESSVRSDLKRGREKLKEILKEAYDFEV